MVNTRIRKSPLDLVRSLGGLFLTSHKKVVFSVGDYYGGLSISGVRALGARRANLCTRNVGRAVEPLNPTPLTRLRTANLKTVRLIGLVFHTRVQSFNSPSLVSWGATKKDGRGMVPLTKDIHEASNRALSHRMIFTLFFLLSPIWRVCVAALRLYYQTLSAVLQALLLAATLLRSQRLN